MFMVAGGHFAGAVIRVGKERDEAEEEPTGKAKRKPKKPKPDNEVLLHKTFHRYTSEYLELPSEAFLTTARSSSEAGRFTISE